MSALNNSLLLGQEGGGGYAISRSLRFNSSDSAYLSRTPASAGNRKTWTLALWHKRSSLSGYTFFAAGDGTAGNRVAVDFDSDQLRLIMGDGTNLVSSTQVFRDPSAWYHFVIAVDTTQGTAANRVKLYINGSEITALSSTSYPSQNYDTFVNAANLHVIGARYRTSVDGYSNGYLADIHFIDGQALTPSSFGEFSATTGVWMPKAYTGTYGTNGFKLNFSDNSTAAALGTDTSGNGNTWSVNNLSVTAGAGNDSLVDVPTNGSEVDTGAGGQVRGNYATLNPLDKGSSITLSNGNLDYSGGASSNTVRATLQPASGKWYWEASGDANTIIGLAAATDSLSVYPGDAGTSGRGYYGSTGISIVNGSVNATWASFTSTDIIGLALDVDAGTCAVYKNSTLQGTWTGLTRPVPALGRTSGVATINFGQRPFAYTAPSGFKALNTASLPAPVVTKPSTVMDVKLYTGNGSTQTISGLGFSPDLVWIKDRQSAFNHTLTDSVRGDFRQLYTNTTGAEEGPYTNYVSLTSDGFSVGNGAYVNTTGKALVAWTWDAGSSTVTNTQGSISSQVRANASAGFSIVTYTGNSTVGATVGHGLGVAPQLIIIKARNNVSGGFWQVYHQAIGNTKYLELNSTSAAGTSSNRWNNTTPSSTVFTLGSDSDLNGSLNYVAYCFAPVAGYSSFGSYTGNGSADGPFVYTGFSPKYILIKRTDAAEDWAIRDVSRSPYNASIVDLAANSSGAEYSSASFNQLDIISNGFKPRNTRAMYNASGGTYVWAAFAESPFQYARAR